MTKKLAVYDDTNGRLYGLDPASAAGLALPAFRPVTTIPATGQLVGEAVINITNGLSYVWDGARWTAIVPPSIVSYATDAAVWADTLAAPGVYAFSQATGNLFVRFNDGTNDVWRQIGIRHFADMTQLQAATVADGSYGYVESTKTLWLYIGGAWKIASLYQDVEATVLAADPAVYTGAIAVATDTGKLFVSDGTSWIGQPFRDYDTEANLLAASPPDGIMAVAKDTGMVFYRTAGAWKSINRYAIPSGATDPAAAASAAGDLFYNTTTNQPKIFDGTNWMTFSTTQLNQLTDVDLTTAPQDKETLVFDGTSNTFKPGKGGGVITGAEPALADRYNGMLWWDGVRLWVWNAPPGVWVQS